MSMGMETIKTHPATKGDYDKANVSQTTAADTQTSAINNNTTVNSDEKKMSMAGKEPSLSTIESAISGMNSKIDMQRTRCEYSYDEPTKRVSIKIYDKDTDELIREVPTEESLKMLQKVWELAGIIVDEKL